MVGIAPGHRVILELAEMARERDVLGPRDVLIAEEEHAVLEQQRADLRPSAPACVPRRRDPRWTSSAPIAQ